MGLSVQVFPRLPHPGIRSWHAWCWSCGAWLFFAAAYANFSKEKLYATLTSLVCNVAKLQFCTKFGGLFPAETSPQSRLGHSLFIPSRPCCLPQLSYFIPQATVGEDSLTCRLGQIIPPLWTMTLGSRSLLNQALPLFPHPGSFLSLSLCLVNQISGISGVFLGQSPWLPALLTTLTLPFKCCYNGQFLTLKLPRIVTRARLGGECLEDVSKLLWND